MKRNYNTGNISDVQFFFGLEVEHTPAYGKKTLFVTGLQSYIEIKQNYANELCEHIFFGANHSYNPQSYEEHKAWEGMIFPLLKEGILCSLDIPINQVEEFNESGFCEYDNFIPQIRVPIPYTKLWNYNTMIKIDDKDFNATNPGVWSHSLHTLMDRSKFTDWNQYSKDKVLK